MFSNNPKSPFFTPSSDPLDQSTHQSQVNKAPIAIAPIVSNPTVIAPPLPPSRPTASPVKVEGDGLAVTEVLIFVKFPIPVVLAYTEEERSESQQYGIFTHSLFLRFPAVIFISHSFKD